MNNFTDPFLEMQKLVNQLSAPYKQIYGIANRVAEPARLAQQHIEIMQTTIDIPLKQFHDSQRSIQNALQRIPTDFFETIRSSLEGFSASIVPDLDLLRKSISFEQISRLDLSFLEGVEIEKAEYEKTSITKSMQDYIQKEVGVQVQAATSNTTTNEWQQFITKLYRALPLHVFLILMQFIFAPFQEYILEEPHAYMQELWEDNTGIDMTSETISMIREETYLRSGRSRQAPLVLQESLMKAQPVLRISRKKNWVQVSVVIDGETYTGWIEKSKVIQP